MTNNRDPYADALSAVINGDGRSSVDSIVRTLTAHVVSTKRAQRITASLGLTPTTTLELVTREAENFVDLTLEHLALATKQEEQDVIAHVPRDWWQHTRQRWLPKWWLKRHPVQRRRITATRTIYNMCRHLPVPEVGSHVHLDFLDGGPNNNSTERNNHG